MSRAADVAELVRAPAALSVLGDSFVGASAAGWPFRAATPALAASSLCLYWAGMALNDYADRDVDAAERPQRPIPSGRVRPGFALGLAGGLTATGLGISGLAGGRRALSVATPLAATVWAYDLALKRTAAGPAAMATARTLDVLLGAGAGRLRRAAPAALTLGGHTLAVTTVSRSEVTGSSPRLPSAALAATAGVTTVAARIAGGGTRLAAAAGPLGTYAFSVGRAQLDAAREPIAERLQRAVGAGIHGMIPLQSALIEGASAGSGRGGRRAARRQLAASAAILAAFPVARALSKKVSPT